MFSRNVGSTLLLLLLLAAGGLATSGCGSGKSDIAHGRVLFQNGTDRGQACAYCHTLRAAYAVGYFAPDLDSDIAEDRRFGKSERQIEKLVRDRIHRGPCFDPHDPSRCMPPDLVTGSDAADVAAFIARCANRPGAPDCLAPKPANPLAAKGQILFGSHYCEGCHSTTGNVAVAPTLKGVAGLQVELTNGKTVTADDNYLLVSILAPDAQIVKGYKAGFMTSLVKPHSISVAQARALVAYIRTLS